MRNETENPIHLNEPMVARLRTCAADTSSNYDGKINIYPPEARGLVDLIDAASELRRDAEQRVDVARELIGTVRAIVETWSTDPGAFPDGAADPLEQIATVLLGARGARRSTVTRPKSSNDRQTCTGCGDEVYTLSSQGFCDGCVEDGTSAKRPYSDQGGDVR